MSEYIKKAEAIERALYTPIMSNGTVEEKDMDAWVDGASDAQEQIAKSIGKIPAENVVKRKRGEWILGHVEPGYFTPGGNRPWVCSECGQVESWHLDRPKTKFCGECGADMREADHEHFV